jgi:hypothetical protein
MRRRDYDLVIALAYGVGVISGLVLYYVLSL